MSEGRRNVYTTGEAARICQVAPRTVAKWFGQGRLRGYRIPGSQARRIPRAELVRFLKESGMPLAGLWDPSRVLLAGLSPALAAAVAALLRGPGGEAGWHEVRAAATPYEAGGLALSWWPGVAVIDFALGRAEALAMAASLAAADAAPCVVGLANEDEPDVMGLRGLGFGVALRKPADPSAVAGVVSAACEGR